MTEQLRPVDSDASVLSFPATPGAEKHASDIALLAEVGEIVRQAMSEMRNDHAVAARICASQAARRLHLVVSGEAV